MLTFFAQGISSFAGNIIIAHLGRDALDAGALVSIIYITVIVFGFGLFSATGVFVAQEHGSKNPTGIRNTVQQSFFLVFVFSFITSLLLWNSTVMLPLSHQSADVIFLATRYLHALTFSILPLMIIVVYEQFFIGLGKTRILLWINLIQIPFEILMMYGFTYGKFGLPKLGIAGLGYGTLVVFCLGVLFVGLFIHFSSAYKKYRLFSGIKFRRDRLIELGKIGVPVGFTYIIELLFYLIIAFLMGRLGANTLAGYQIANQFLNLSIIIAFAIGQVVTARMSYALGKNELSLSKHILLGNLLIGFIIMASISVIYIVIPEKILSIDLNVYDPKFHSIVHTAIAFLIIGTIVQTFDTLRYITYGALRGLKDTVMPLIYSIIAFFFVALPSGYFLAFKLNYGGMGLWYGVFIGVVFCMIIFLFRFNHFILQKEIIPIAADSEL
jgi:MATE family multidrug resistance protein